MGPRGEVGKGLSQAKQRRLAQIDREFQARQREFQRRVDAEVAAIEAENRRRMMQVLSATHRRDTATA